MLILELIHLCNLVERGGEEVSGGPAQLGWMLRPLCFLALQYLHSPGKL